MFAERTLAGAMKYSSNELLDDTCWVYVQQDTRGSYTVGITYEEEFPEREASVGRRPLLWRRFEDTLSAAGYRMVLKKLPPYSFRKLLREQSMDCEH